jgi:hypothetical protein
MPAPEEPAATLLPQSACGLSRITAKLPAGFLCWFFLRRLGLSLRRSFRRLLGSGGLLGSVGFRRWRFLFGSLFVRITSVIGGVEPRSLEDQTRAGAQQAFHLTVTPLRQPAKLLRAFAEWFVAHRLERFEGLAALLTRIFVSWHERRLEVCTKDVLVQPVEPLSTSNREFTNDKHERRKRMDVIRYMATSLHWMHDLTIQRFNASTWRSHSRPFVSISGC